MIRQVYVVLWTYLTRPLFWVLTLIYFVSLGFILTSALNESGARPGPPLVRAYPAPNFGSATFSANSAAVFDDLTDQKDSHRLSEAVSVEILDLEAAGSPRALTSSRLSRLRTLPKLRSLTLVLPDRTLNQDVTAELGQLKQLESLTLHDCLLNAELWQALGQLPKLRYLDLSRCELPGSFPNLQMLTQLQTLVLGKPATGPTANSEGLFAQLKRLPQLTTLVIWDFNGMNLLDPNSARFRDDMDDLAAISTLRWMFVHEQFHSGTSIEALSRRLPHVRVRPVFIEINRQYRLIPLVWLNSILMILIGAQLQSQFSQSQSRLIPHYLAPHVAPLFAIWAIGLALNSLVLIPSHVGSLVSLGVNLGCWAVLCGLGFLLTAAQWAPRRLQFLTMGLALTSMIWYPRIAEFLHWNSSSIDWLLRGHDPVSTATLIFFGIVFSGLMLRQNVRMQTLLLERGVTSPPIGFYPPTKAQWRQDIGAARPFWLWRFFDRRLEHVIERSREEQVTGWGRWNLWIAGNPASGNFAPVASLAVLIVATLASRMVLQDSSPLAGLQSPSKLMLSVIMPDLPILLLAVIWRSRRPNFAAESLRGVSRHEYSRQIAQAIAWDMTPIAGIYLAVLGWYVSQADARQWSWGWTGAMLLVFVARWICLYGLVLWVIVIRRDWVLALAAAPAGYVLILANTVIFFLQGRVLGVHPLPPDFPDLGVLSLAAIALGFGIVGAGIAWGAYRRWQRIELV